MADWGVIAPDPFANLNTLVELEAQQPRNRVGLTRVKAMSPALDQTAL
ncbi:hypothetical protein [Caulobacter sp. LjRoot300]